MYVLPKNIKRALAQRSSRYRLQQAIRQAWPSVFWGIRVAFGASLIISLVAIFTTISFIHSSQANSDDENDRTRRGRRHGTVSFQSSYFYDIWGPSPFDFLYWNRPYGYYGRYNGDYNQGSPDEMCFLTSVFSYVFGDGDPNANFEVRRLQLASTMIRLHNGAVTAEQLAPFCDNIPDPVEVESRTYVDEVRSSFTARVSGKISAFTLHSPRTTLFLLWSI